MIKLTDILNEIKINKPTIKIPDGWKKLNVYPEPDLEEDFEVESYGAPMEGWDTDHYDVVNIMSTPKYDALADDTTPLETKYFIRTFIAFGGMEDEDERYNSLYDAQRRAVELMKEIIKDWDNDIHEIKINKPTIKIPDEWSEMEIDSDPKWNNPEYDHDVEAYSAPMDGWDNEHPDTVYIMSTPVIDEKTKQPIPADQIKYFISVNYAFGGREDEDKEYDSIDSARRHAVEVMEDIMKDWDNDIYETKINQPITFNTNSSKGKLWVDYNPQLRQINDKELSLLSRVYNALKPVENRLDDYSLRLSPSLDRVMMKYGYWEWIEDKEILKALKDFDIEIEDDYDDDRGQTTYYMVKDKQ